jgi:TIGR03009 family protein
MRPRTIACLLTAVVLTATVAMAQQQYPPNGGYQQPSGGNYQPSGQPNGGYGQPDQPVQPQDPTLERRGAQPGMQPGTQPGMQQPGMPRQEQPRQKPPEPPFKLTPEEQSQVDQLLALWERHNKSIKTFDCRFKRWTYDTVFGRPDQPRFVELGVLRYSEPDKGIFQTTTSEQNGKEIPIDPRRAEHWVSDGKSIIEFDHVKQQVIVHKLPPNLQGKAIADTPLPFLFGSEAATLKKRYFIRLLTPPGEVKSQQIWLEAYPRFQEDAANFHHARFIISLPKLEPYALQLTQPNGKNYISYSFYDIIPNEPFRIFKGDPFRPVTPIGWTKVVEEPQGVNARQPANNGRR